MAAAQGRKLEVTVKPRKKVNAKVKNEAKTEAAPKAASASAPARPEKLKVLKKDTKYRGARAEWFARLLEYDGKTQGEYIESCKEKPPAMTKNNTAENPTGWVRFFVRTGVLSVQA